MHQSAPVGWCRSAKHSPSAPRPLGASDSLFFASDGGVAGYAIYRDGGASAIGTVSGSTTSFADTSVAPGSTYAYTVAAFDAAGNYSPQSAPSDAVTTPQ